MLSPARSGHLPVSQAICSRCRLRMSRTHRLATRWSSVAVSAARDSPPHSLRAFSVPDYFSANSQLPRRERDASFHRATAFFRSSRPGSVAAFASAAVSRSTSKILDSFASTSDTSSLSRQSRPQSLQEQSTNHTAAIPEKPVSIAPTHEIPPDASATLSKRASKLPPTSLRRHLASYLALSKPRLTFLMVLTTASAYALYPVPTILSSATSVTPSLSALTLVYLTSGTALCSASANALNMLMEPEHDAKMSRTRNRPLVRGLIGKRGALLFAVACGSLGTAGLYFGVNPTVSFLGAFNILLYAGMYTPLKRISVLNTWVGAVVGAIPPLMGWAAASGQHATEGSWQELLLGASNAGGWLLATLLYAWQFPHFNALSWTIRAEYQAAGYRMMAWVNERRNARIALRYAFWFFPICAGLTYVGVTDRGFLVSSTLLNGWLLREAYWFWRHQGHRGSARALFWAGVWQLPGLLVLAMFHKQGLWDGVWRWIQGEGAEDEMAPEAQTQLLRQNDEENGARLQSHAAASSLARVRVS